MARRTERAFIWVPKAKSTRYSIEIDGVDLREEIVTASFTKSIIGLDSPCNISLIDVDGRYADTFVGGETIELKMDFSDGTTSQWKGTLEKPKKRFGANITVEIKGSHFQSDLLDITVTGDLTGGTTADDILKSIVDDHLTGYTYTNVTASTVTPTIKWQNKPFWDCIVDLCDVTDFDCFLDEDKDFHFFARESLNNDDEAIVWNDNMLEIIHLGVDTVDVKNRIIVYGEDEAGSKVIYQTDDTASQTTFGIKENIIQDSSIRTYTQAKELGDALLANQKDTANSGKIEAIILPDLRLGEMTYIIDPIQKVHARYRVVKYTHTLPEERTTVIVGKEKTIPTVLKQIKLEQLGKENLINPFKMKNSYNFTFDDLTKIDTVLSERITVSESNLKISSGTDAVMISNKRESSTDITKVHLKVVGDALSGTIYSISTDDGVSYQTVALESEVSVTAGKNLRVKIELNSTSTLIDSFVVLYR